MNEQLQKLLATQLEGEIRFDLFSRAMHSTDASIYQLMPIGVATPKNRDDLIKIVKFANRHETPLLPRGGGTSLAGQTVGNALVIDLSRHMNQIIEVNKSEKWAKVQPGVILDQLNYHLEKSNLMFAPDVATSSRATIGGMVGNNSAGVHSIVYGKTIDHVIALKLILPNGDELTAETLSSEQLQAKKSGNSIESQIYRGIDKIIRENSDEIEKRFPKIMRRVSGYNLRDVVNATILVPPAEGEVRKERGCDKSQFNLAKIIVGSEGTLAMVSEIKVGLVDRPKITALMAIHFEKLEFAMDAVNPILEFQPSAVELIDKSILDMTKKSIGFRSLRSFIHSDPEAILAVEFFGESQKQLSEKLAQLEAKMKSIGLGYAFSHCLEISEQEKVWKVRKAGLGLLMGMVGDRKSTTFIEDCAVDPILLPEYFRKLKKTIEKYKVVATYYAHVSVGLMHVRPMLNLKDRSEIAKMRSIAEEVCQLVLEFGGTMSGEHGDGLARSEWIEQMFGAKIYEAFCQVKNLFDPKNLMNPGKIIDSPPMTENLRFRKNRGVITIDEGFDFSAQGGLNGAIELCNGAGVCRQTFDGTMCPSYMATREEKDSTRGRANALRTAIEADDLRLWKSRNLYEIMDLCLECKACKSECPAGVDMAKLKSQFLSDYHKKYRPPLRNHIFANIDRLNEIAQKFPIIANYLMNLPISKKILGIDRRREIPSVVQETFEQWFRKRPIPSVASRKVIIFHDTFTNYNYPEVGRSAVKILESAGFEVLLPEKYCCGRPSISKGMLDRATQNARYNVNQLEPYAKAGIPIIFCEPSCFSAIADDYLDLLSGDKSAKIVAENSFMLDQFLVEKNVKLDFSREHKNILLHVHCHQNALNGTNFSKSILSMPENYKIELTNAGCCGMAGSFGYEKEHYQLSVSIAEQQLLKVIEEKSGKFELAITGVSCRQQLEHCRGNRVPKHSIELLAGAIC